MSRFSSFNPKPVIDLFCSGIIEAPLKIQVELGEEKLNATLDDTGQVIFNGRHYADIHQAMLATNRQVASTSNAWQFWTWFNDERQAWTPLEHLRASLAFRDIQSEIRTSYTHPLRVDSVVVPGAKGRIGLTFCPGKRCAGLYGGIWDRDLNMDIIEIKNWGARTLLTLMESQEFDLLGVSKFSEILDSNTIDWKHLPIQDMQTPNAFFEQKWQQIGPRLHRQLIDGQSIVIHCRGGLGRTGLLAARILVEAGMEPVEAVAAVKAARANSIETYKQEHYVLTEGWKLV